MGKFLGDPEARTKSREQNKSNPIFPMFVFLNKNYYQYVSGECNVYYFYIREEKKLDRGKSDEGKEERYGI